MDPSNCTAGIDENGNPIVNCSGPDTVTVNGGTPPDIPTLGGGIGECPFYGCVPNCSIFTCGPMPGQPGGGGGGGGSAPPPTPPGLQVSTSKLIKSFNQCAANFADKYSAASILHVNNVPGLGTVLGSSTAAASNLLFGTHPSQYVPAGTNLAAGVKAGSIVVGAATIAGKIPIDQGFQSIFTTVAPTQLGETAAGSAAVKGAEGVASLLDRAVKPLVLWDELTYGYGEAACAAQAF